MHGNGNFVSKKQQATVMPFILKFFEFCCKKVHPRIGRFVNRSEKFLVSRITSFQKALKKEFPEFPGISNKLLLKVLEKQYFFLIRKRLQNGNYFSFAHPYFHPKFPNHLAYISKNFKLIETQSSDNVDDERKNKTT